MGGVMGAPMYAWILLFGLLGLLFIGGVFGVLTVIARRPLPRGGADDPTARAGARQADEAQAALKRRYAAGEISREDYLQAKVELED